MHRPKKVTMKLAAIFILASSIFVSTAASAATHVWTPSPAQQAANTQMRALSVQNPSAVYVTLPLVTITGHIEWGDGSFDGGQDTASTFTSGGNSLAQAISDHKERALSLTNVCSNPTLSADLKTTTTGSGTEGRWLAAMAMISSIDAAGLFTWYGAAYGSIAIIVDGKTYGAFKVTYADGARETWMVTPNHLTSSMKLFDTPLPGSLTAPTKAGC